jgi:hypothetical protein
MPNWEYYAQMQKSREDWYIDAYTKAYRDLNAVYESELQTQQLLFEQLTLDKENNAALIKIIANPPAGVALKDLDTLVKLQQKYDEQRLQARKASASNTLKAKEIVESKYELPSSFHGRMEKEFADMRVGLQRATTDQYLSDHQIHVDNLVALFASLPSDEARAAAAAEYYPRLQELGWVDSFEELSGTIGYLYKTPREIQKGKEEETKALEKETQVYINRDARDTAAQIKTLVDTKLKEYVSIQEGEDGTLKIIEKFRVATPTVQDISKIPELQPIKPPQEQDILVRTAEYYEPFGTEDFKQQVAQLEDERKQRKQFKEQAEEEARQQLEASLPEWGGRALRVGGAVKESLGKSDDDLKELGQPEKLAFGLVDTDLTMSEKIAKIDEVKEWSDTERDRALTVLMRDMMKKRNKRIEDSAAEILKPEK